MKKLFIILCTIIFVSCSCAPNQGTKEPTVIPAEQIYISGLFHLYIFEYEGHKYMTSWDHDVLIHLSSCPCHNNSYLNNSYLYN